MMRARGDFGYSCLLTFGSNFPRTEPTAIVDQDHKGRSTDFAPGNFRHKQQKLELHAISFENGWRSSSSS